MKGSETKKSTTRLGGRNNRWYGDEDALVDAEERNLVEFPLALLSRHVPDGRKVIRFEDFIPDKAAGRAIHRTLEISANAASHLPNWWDQDFLLALKVLTNRKNGWSNFVVEFSAYEVLKLMRLPNESRNRKLIAKSFDNWQGVRFKYSHWRKGDAWVEPKAFCLIQDYDLTRKGRKKPDAPQVFAWSRILFESMQDAHIKPFDSDFYFSLKSPTARRACRFLDKRLHNGEFFQAPLEAFCRHKLGMSEYRFPADYRSKLSPAYDELVARGFLGEVDKEKRYRDVKGQPGVFFRRGRRSGKRVKGRRVALTQGDRRHEQAEKTPADIAKEKAEDSRIRDELAEVEAYLAGLDGDEARAQFEEDAAQRSPLREHYYRSKEQGSPLFAVWRMQVLREACRRLNDGLAPNRRDDDGN